MRKVFTLLLIGLAAVAACGGDAGPAAPEVPNIVGVWSYGADLAGGPVTCQIADVEASLAQSGGTFSGTTQGGTIACQSGQDSGSDQLGSFVITDGVLSGGTLTFTLTNAAQGDPLNMSHQGSVTDGSMSGTTTAQFTLPPPYDFVVTLAGTWSATRQ